LAATVGGTSGALGGYWLSRRQLAQQQKRLERAHQAEIERLQQQHQAHLNEATQALKAENEAQIAQLKHDYDAQLQAKDERIAERDAQLQALNSASEEADSQEPSPFPSPEELSAATAPNASELDRDWAEFESLFSDLAEEATGTGDSESLQTWVDPEVEATDSDRDWQQLGLEELGSSDSSNASDERGNRSESGPTA